MLVLLGDGNSSFFSTFLDVNVGNGGGAFVQVLNTTTFGPYLQLFGIMGGGSGNSIFIDASSNNNGVTFDSSSFFGGIH